MTKRFKSLIVPSFALLSILGALLFGILKVSMPTYAAHPSANPQVVIAVDTTNQSCFKKIAKTLHALHTSAAIQMPCPAGTVIQSVDVSLSIAKADHEAYVVLPSGNASQSVWKQTNNQIDKLVAAKRNAIQHTSRKKVHPDNDCGDYEEIGTYPTVVGDELYVDTDYQISYSCNNLVLDRTKVFGLTSPTALYFWQWRYASDARRYEVPGCRFTGTNQWTFPIDDVDPIGYVFIWYFTWPYCLSPNQPTVSIGPLI